MRKKTLALLLAALLAAGCLSGCGGKEVQESKEAAPESVEKDEEPEKSEEADGSPESSQVLGEGSGDAAWDTGREDTITLCVINNFYTAGEKKLAEEYMKLHPETKVVVDVVADNDTYMTKMMTSMEGDRENAPDIVHGNFLAAATAGSMGVCIEQGYLYDMTGMLEEDNPYNGGKVGDAFEEEDIVLAINGSGGKYVGFLPFDKIGFALFYNKDILEKLDIEPPTTWEELVEVCGKLKEAGYEVPVSAGPESCRMVGMLADAYYRGNMDPADYLVQPGDALWDAQSMADNEGYAYDEGDPYCSQFLVNSQERTLRYRTQTGYATEANRRILEEFYKVAQYFPDNWIAADSTQAITDFESQISPMLYQASYNAGSILNDIKALPEDMRFEWATCQIEGFENPPEGFGKEFRGLWILGNAMSIVDCEDADHLARIKDFYKYWYSQDGARMCFEETLNNGNFVQGPCVVKGVTLEPDLEQLLAGFRTYPVQGFEENMGVGVCYTSADMPLYYDNMNRFTSGEITAEEFLQNVEPLCQRYNQEVIQRAGFDLDPATADQAAE